MIMDRWQRETRIRAGASERRKIGEIVLYLIWDVWRTQEEERKQLPPKGRFTIERAHISGRLVSKHTYDDFELAVTAFDSFEREYAIEQAKEALGLNQDTVKIRRPPTF